ncbi:hypothetical protein FQR65_LT11455 [Abscondita terminalis]|nr:hypothetical protein FQR65_LT11455 [Abscondita terminalis]
MLTVGACLWCLCFGGNRDFVAESVHKGLLQVRRPNAPTSKLKKLIKSCASPGFDWKLYKIRLPRNSNKFDRYEIAQNKAKLCLDNTDLNTDDDLPKKRKSNKPRKFSSSDSTCSSASGTSYAHFNEERCLIDNPVPVTGLEDGILRKKAVENKSFVNEVTMISTDTFYGKLLLVTKLGSRVAALGLKVEQLREDISSYSSSRKIPHKPQF